LRTAFRAPEVGWSASDRHIAITVPDSDPRALCHVAGVAPNRSVAVHRRQPLPHQGCQELVVAESFCRPQLLMSSASVAESSCRRKRLSPRALDAPCHNAPVVVVVDHRSSVILVSSFGHPPRRCPFHRPSPTLLSRLLFRWGIMRDGRDVRELLQIYPLSASDAQQAQAYQV
jgi:hypothetical protein